MNKGIVIGTGRGREKQFDNLMLSIHTDYKVYPVYRDDFELGVFMHVFYETDLDEFLFLHDTCEIKDNKMFDKIFKEWEGCSVALATHPNIFGMYLGKYRREVLKNMKIPIINNKNEAVDYEIYFNIEYSRKEEPNKLKILKPALFDNNIFEEKFGRKNMKLENDWLIKYKGCWDRSMI